MDKTFPGSDLLQKYWLYTTSSIHRGRQSIHAFQDTGKVSVTPIPTAEAFNAVMTQSRLLEVAKNILASTLPFAPNPDFTASLLVNFRKAADSVPIDICTEFIEAIREL